MAAETEIKLPDAFQQHRLLSFKEAAQFLGIRPGTMYKMLASKKDPLPSIRWGIFFYSSFSTTWILH